MEVPQLATTHSLWTGYSTIHFPQRYEPNCAWNALSGNVEESVKKSPCGSICGWLTKFNQFFHVHRYVSGKIFTKIGSVVFLREVANRQIYVPSHIDRCTMLAEISLRDLDLWPRDLQNFIRSSPDWGLRVCEVRWRLLLYI